MCCGRWSPSACMALVVRELSYERVVDLLSIRFLLSDGRRLYGFRGIWCHTKAPCHTDEMLLPVL